MRIHYFFLLCMKKLLLFTFVFGICALPESSFAHSSEGISGGIVGGFMHPIGGLDHITAMVAVGILGAFLGSNAKWILPVVFPLVMVVGGVMGILNLPFGYLETGIALSSVILGGMIAWGYKKIPLWIAGIAVSIFAVFHGYAHGAEMGENTQALAYAIGFVIATGLLHLAGILFGEIQKIPYGTHILRASGGIIALAGFGFLFGWI